MYSAYPLAWSAGWSFGFPVMLWTSTRLGSSSHTSARLHCLSSTTTYASPPVRRSTPASTTSARLLVSGSLYSMSISTRPRPAETRSWATMGRLLSHDRTSERETVIPSLIFNCSASFCANFCSTGDSSDSAVRRRTVTELPPGSTNGSCGMGACPPSASRARPWKPVGPQLSQQRLYVMTDILSRSRAALSAPSRGRRRRCSGARFRRACRARPASGRRRGRRRAG